MLQTYSRLFRRPVRSIISVIPIRVDWQPGFHQPFQKKTAPTPFGFYGADGSGGFADPDDISRSDSSAEKRRRLALVELVRPILNATDATNCRWYNPCPKPTSPTS